MKLILEHICSKSTNCMYCYILVTFKIRIAFFFVMISFIITGS